MALLLLIAAADLLPRTRPRLRMAAAVVAVVTVGVGFAVPEFRTSGPQWWSEATIAEARCAEPGQVRSGPLVAGPTRWADRVFTVACR